MTDLSIVTTMYQSAPHLEEFYRRCCAAAEKITKDYEIIFVNDGSPDNSLDIAVSLHERDGRVTVIDLSRNFNHHKAMMTGLAHARGKLVFLIDCDLEEDPELLEVFHKELLASGADVVYGVQETREGRLFGRMAARLFYAVFNALSTDPIPVNLLTVRLMTARYVAALVQHRERETVIAGLWAITGFTQKPLTVKKHRKGTTTYTLARRVAQIVNAITSFSNKPLVLIFYLGMFMVIASLLGAAYLFIRRAFFGVMLAGYPSMMVTICTLGGVTIFCLGVIGIYLSKVFTEAKQRPYTIIRHIYERRPAKQEMLSQEMLRKVGGYYTEKLILHGATPQGVDWNSPESQTVRFEQLLKVREDNSPFTINDYGCGYGALIDYLVRAGCDFKYRGFDISEAMVAKARELHEGKGPYSFVTDESLMTPADYTVASGVFNVKMNASDEEWERHVLRTIDTIARLSTKGFAFNVLTRYADPELMRPDLYYADPCFLFDYCRRRYSRWVTLLHDYGLYEFTILVRRRGESSWLTS